MRIVFLALVVALTASAAFAHPGRTAADGCHYCRTNCASWGEVAGARHCHGQKSAPPPRQNPPPHPLPKQPRVVDGDTLIVAGVRVRLAGIDAPEADQYCRRAGQLYWCGAEATQALQQKIGRGLVDCTPSGRDIHGRTLGVCRAADGTDLNSWLVQMGHALAYRQYSQRYLPEEFIARSLGRGLWAGEFVAPWAWRRGQRRLD